MQATYSPEDNKLRLYPVSRLDSETYARVKEAGFSWAAKQGLFVAPMWTPAREDLLIELCGEIEDEDKSLVDRAEERAERFEEYEEKRAEDAERAHAAVAEIADGIPLGQPILVGHHSEKRARKHAERIDAGIRRAVKMWETSQYWAARAAGAIRHAKYKERPEVRARRIKGLEADARKQERSIKDAELFLKFWRDVLTLDQAKAISNVDHISRCFPLADYPRNPPASQYEGLMSLWSALDGGIINAAQARDIAIPAHERSIEHAQRWLNHTNNRLAYERAMLDEQGASELLAPKARPKQLPICNYRAPEGIDCENIYYRGETIRHPQIEMTAAEYAAINKDYKGTRVCEGSHRVRTAMVKSRLVCVFLTDKKVTEKPDPITTAPEPTQEPRIIEREVNEPSKFDALKGVKVEAIAAPQLFPTPAPLAKQAVELAQIEAGHRVLEPSAGTGNILAAISAADVTAIEINADLCSRLTCKTVINRDFLQCNGELGAFDRVVMNPPFENGQDIKHIRHALGMLKPGGRLVAICANGPRQRAQLMPIADEWIDLPPGSFAASGTNVNAAMLVINKGE